MATTDPCIKLAPAYVSFSAFVSFLDRRLSDGLPDKIDRSIMDTMSGGTQAHLLSSLKFLGLIDDDCQVTGNLRSLVHAKQQGEEGYHVAMKEVAASAYSVVLGDLDIQRITPRQLHEKFRDAGAEGGTLTKAIRFYLSLLTECGVAYPKNFNQTMKSGVPRAKKTENLRSKPERQAEEQCESSSPDSPTRDSPKGSSNSSSLIQIPIPTIGNPHRVASVPSDLNEADCKYLAVMIEAIANRLAASRPQGSTP